MNRNYPELIMQKDITYKKKKINIAIYKTTYFYDIIISSDVKSLIKLRKLQEHANLIDYTIFEYPILIWDTTQTIDEAKFIYDMIEEMI